MPGFGLVLLACITSIGEAVEVSFRDVVEAVSRGGGTLASSWPPKQSLLNRAASLQLQSTACPTLLILQGIALPPFKHHKGLPSLPSDITGEGALRAGGQAHVHQRVLLVHPAFCACAGARLRRMEGAPSTVLSFMSHMI